ncbi:hypothetical protein MK079_04950 [Candidatus Gracilibacteria bacterium]|nr:hypothetical protein [Candidatus Gracilibacteria bacterium]
MTQIQEHDIHSKVSEETIFVDGEVQGGLDDFSHRVEYLTQIRQQNA